MTAVSMRHKLVGWDTHRHARRTAARSGRLRPVISNPISDRQWPKDLADIVSARDQLVEHF